MKIKQNADTINYRKIFSISRADILEDIKAGKVSAERHGDLIFLHHDGVKMNMRAVIKLKIPQPAKRPYRRRKNSLLTSLVPSIFRKRK